MMKVRGVVFSALFAALVVVFSYIRIRVPGSPVPIVLENMVPMLAGVFLGPLYGFFSMLLVLLLTIIGVPMLGGEGGIGIIAGPTGGFVVAWAIAAWLIGLGVSKLKGSKPLTFIGILAVVIVCGALVPYVIGVPWLAVSAKMSIGKAMVAGCYPFVLGDILKAVVTAIVGFLVRQVYPTERLVGSGGAAVVKLES